MKTNSVDLGTYKVTGVNQCPNCDSKLYAHVKGFLNYYHVECNDCDFSSKIHNQLPRELRKEEKAHQDFTRVLFNNWNQTVAEHVGEPFKKVRIYQTGN